ncbi:unnamed protein product [Adineta steineri]|uniref:Uncharacterized protein n=1 Tax=Adineta steineri TaxID=433720 RepID=A0A818HSC1_9BILA|nr:unnamed protein product [Adineta steineri]CAF1016010.1 unnamed protein product [Adineta steineri]CAF1029548.1 unnamed protein product [Adineta steineri]CAF1073483.1 unnamed protein product [Adineta steineri]CAF1179549.1 unnamed protein product [Adineta steineri]
MAAGGISMNQRNNLSPFADQDPRDGMSASTKRHFDHVKRKMLAFVDRQHRRKKTDRGMQYPPLPPFQHHPPPPPAFADKNRAPKQLGRHATPLLLHKQSPHFPGHVTPQKQLMHHGFATPQAQHRMGKQGSHEGKLHPNVAFF